MNQTIFFVSVTFCISHWLKEDCFLLSIFSIIFAVFSTAFELRGADVPVFSCAEMGETFWLLLKMFYF
jgi:hypothetical protein